MSVPTLTTLSNGMKLAHYRIPGAQSVRMLMYVHGGASSEPREAHGLAHYVEHLTFFGNSKSTGATKSDRLTSIGYDINARTDEQGIEYSFVGLGATWREALAELCHIVTTLDCTEEEFQTEKDVVARELHGDSCWDMINEMHNQLSTGGSELARSIGGDEESVKALTLDACRKWFEEIFVPANMILTIVGDVPRDEIEAVVMKEIAANENGQAYKQPVLSYAGGETTYGSRCSEGHLSLSFPIEVASPEQNYAAYILRNILGSGPSSLLFKRLRDEEGLSYRFGCAYDNFENLTAISLWLDCEAKRLLDAAEVCSDIIKEVSNGVSEEVFKLHQMRLLGHNAYEIDSPSNFAYELATMVRYFDQVLSPAECIAYASALTCNDVNEMLFSALSKTPSLTAMGPISKLPTLKSMGLDQLLLAEAG